MVRYRCLLVFVLVIASNLAFAQNFRLSSEPDSFAVDVVRSLRSIRLEATKKVASDFKTAWDTKITDTQKLSMIEICSKMKNRRLPGSPYYRYFFSLTTYALTQENASEEEFSEILNIIHYGIDNYNKKELANFYQTLTYFFARGFIYYSHYNKLTSKGGSYKIELLEELTANLEDPIYEEEEIEEEEEEFISEDDLADYGDDSWGSDDDWSSDDDWGSDTSDDWGSDDGWGSSDDDGIGVFADPDEEPKEEVFVRSKYDYVKPDLVAQFQANDIHPPIGGAVIHLMNMDLKMATPYDTITIENASGTLLLREQVFIGEAGKFDWPDDLRGTDGAVVYFDQYSFSIRSAEIKTARAKMVFPRMFEDSVAGAFHFKSGRRAKKQIKTYPKFTSLYSNITVKLPGENMDYNGGFGIVGAQKMGTSISKVPSVLKVEADSGRSYKSKAVKYLFFDSLITSDRAELFLYHDRDSIYHPSVQMKHDSSIPKLTLLKQDGGFKNTYYYSSFFKMEFKADLIEWALEADSLDISIMNAPNRIPALFESEDYFNPIRYNKMTGLFGFHPIMLVVQYARKVQDSQFSILELIATYEIDERTTHSAILFLQQNSYITFDEESGNIKVLRKAFHYVMSNTALKDYDNFLVSSVWSKEPNASLNFVKKEMDVRGVKRVYITPDQEVYIEPKDSLLTLLEDKSMKFDGMVNAEGFQYKGHDFILNYNEYLMEMESIDSIRIQVLFEEGEDADRTPLHHHLEATSGTLYINDPKNKAGLKEYVQYPYFVSDSEAIVYFDSKEILDGAYDKSIYFIIPPFKSDTVGQESPDQLGFEGTFHSGNILPPIKETLNVMPDKSLGFVHTIPEEGYNLYDGGGVLYDTVYLDYGGLQGNGKIEYRTAEVNSKEFIFYMDSVTAEGVKGLINEGQMGDATYPEAILADFKMLWLPLKDSLYMENRLAPFKFYNSTALLEGKANITAKGVYGSGEMLSRGSKSKSSEFHFEIDKYSGRHSEFEILTSNPNKPAMAGDDIFFEFDLVDNVVEIRPEIAGEPAIAFPYAQMRTSITNANWNLDSDIIEMRKPEEVDISYSYFYSTKEELDSLVFNATGAVYNIDYNELHIYGIPYIRVADAEITPEGNETTILENSVLETFENAKLKMDTLNGYHNLYDGHITIQSRKKFEGYATYELTNPNTDTFAIQFESFNLFDVPNSKGDDELMTVSSGLINQEDHVIISPGFYYKGDVTMYAKRKSLKKRGYVNLDMPNLGFYDYWVEYNSPGDSSEVYIDLKQAKTESGDSVVAGILYDDALQEYYMSFVSGKTRPANEYFFKADDFLFYDQKTKEFKIEDLRKTFNNSYAGKSFIYNDEKSTLSFEGPVNFIKNKEEFNIKSSVYASVAPKSNSYSLDAMLLINMDIHSDLIDAMTYNMIDMIEQVGHEVAHKNRFELLVKLAEFVGDEAAKKYENSTLKNYTPLVETSEALDHTLAFSNVDIKWSNKEKAWYNSSRLGLSNIRSTDINALADGFLEIKKTDEGEDVVHLFLQVAPSTWYFFSYEHGRLMLYSSNPEYNNLIAEHSTVSNTGFGEYTTVEGDEFEVLKFINEFRSKYYGISDDYNLEFPDETHLTEDIDEFNTIDKEEEEAPVDVAEPLEEDEDDGF